MNTNVIRMFQGPKLAGINILAFGLQFHHTV